jgi:shikimate 5-dehydrogenase
VGAGGAARAAAFALVRAGARVDVLARRAEQAREVAAATGSAGAGLEELARVPYDVLVNATPLGSGALPGESPVSARALRPGSVVFDIVYEPRVPPLLADARARAARRSTASVLVAQAAGQFGFDRRRRASRGDNRGALDAIEASRVPQVAEAAS